MSRIARSSLCLVALALAGCRCGVDSLARTSDGGRGSDGSTDSGDPIACLGACCGNGLLDPSEDCDGAKLGFDEDGQVVDCQDLGFHDGPLSCTAACTYDTSYCKEQICPSPVKGIPHDLDADGSAELLVGAPTSMIATPAAGRAMVFAAGLGGAPYDSGSDGAGSDRFGAALAHAGDLNGDGIGDVAVGVGWDDQAGGAAGFVNVYLSEAACIPGLPLLSGPEITLTGGPGETFGAAVASGGDMDGDGLPELIVGAPGLVMGDTGHAYVFSGGTLGLSGPPAALSGTGYGYYFGSTVAGGGDVSGDGVLDVAVGLFHRIDEGSGTVQEGQVHLFFGTAGALPDDVYDSVLWPSVGSAVDSLFGFAVSFVGDFDGDGDGDLAVGAPGIPGDGGVVYVYLGGLTSGTYFVGAPGERLGSSLEALGDMDGDGDHDFAAGAAGAGGGAGSVYVYPGSMALAVPIILTVAGTAALGRSLAAGDFDGDGSADLAASAAEVSGDGTGRVFVWFDVGSAATGAAPGIELAGEMAGDGFGTAID